MFTSAASKLDVVSKAGKSPGLLQRKEKKSLFSGDLAQENSSSHFLQPKLTIGAPDDPYEREADAVADRVMTKINGGGPGIQRMSEDEETVQTKPLTAEISPIGTLPALHRKCATCEKEEEVQRQTDPSEEEPIQTKALQAPAIQRLEEKEVQTKPISTIQRKCAACESEEQLQRQVNDREEDPIQTKPAGHIQRQEEEELQAKPDSVLQRKCAACEKEEQVQMKAQAGAQPASARLHSQLHATKGGGQPMSDRTRMQMEGAFGTDFSGVRIHTGSQSTQMNKELNSKAFTHGADIHFNSGQYNPVTSAGRHLLAHELTHVIQQKGKRQHIQRFSKACRKLLDKAGLIILRGTKVHKAIKKDFDKRVPGAIKKIPTIPGATSLPFRIGTRPGTSKSGKPIEISPTDRPTPEKSHPLAFTGIPDLAAKQARIMSVAEIKPAIWADLSGKGEDVLTGASQLAKYIEAANGTDRAIVSWRNKHKIDKVIPVIPRMYRKRKISVGGYKVWIRWCAPGLMVYKPLEIDKKKKKKKKKSKTKTKSAKTQPKKTPKKAPKTPKPKGGAKLGAYNFGLGISINSSGGGVGNIGFGVSINSQGVAIGTISGGLVKDSTGATIGTVSGGKSEGSTTASAGSGSLGKSEGDMSAGAGTAGFGESKGNVSATAGQKGSGTKGKTGAQAGQKGDASKKSGHTLKVKAMSQEEVDKAVQQAAEIDKMLQKATPAQKRLIENIVKQQKGKQYKVPNPVWIKNVLEATEGINTSDADKLAKKMNWTPNNKSADDLKKDVQGALKKGEEKGEKQGERDEKDKDSTASKFERTVLHPKAQAVYDLILRIKGLKATNELEKLNQIVPKELSNDQLHQLDEKLSSLQRDKKASIASLLMAIDQILKEQKKSGETDEQKKLQGTKKQKKKKNTPKSKASKSGKANLAEQIPLNRFFIKDKKTDKYSTNKALIEKVNKNALPYQFGNGIIVRFKEFKASIIDDKMTIGGKATDVQLISASFTVFIVKVPNTNKEYKLNETFEHGFSQIYTPKTGTFYYVYQAKVFSELNKITQIVNGRIRLKSGIQGKVKNLGEIRAKIFDVKHVGVTKTKDSKTYTYRVTLEPRVIKQNLGVIEGNQMIYFKVGKKISFDVTRTVND